MLRSNRYDDDQALKSTYSNTGYKNHISNYSIHGDNGRDSSSGNSYYAGHDERLHDHGAHPDGEPGLRDGCNGVSETQFIGHHMHHHVIEDHCGGPGNQNDDRSDRYEGGHDYEESQDDCWYELSDDCYCGYDYWLK
jgi:hypothetical protein